MIFTMEKLEDCAGWDSFIGWADLRRGGTEECRVRHLWYTPLYILESNKIATTLVGFSPLFTALSGYQETSTTLFRYEYHHMHFHNVAHGPTFDPIHLQL